MLEVKNLNKSYESGGRTYPVLQDVNFRVEKGEFVVQSSLKPKKVFLH